MKISLELSEAKYQHLTERAKEWDMSVPEFIEHLVTEDQHPLYELSHDMGTASFHNIRDAIKAMYLIDDYHNTDACFLRTEREAGRIWETVAGGDTYRNGIYGIC